jgi:hypothetical protein
MSTGLSLVSELEHLATALSGEAEESSKISLAAVAERIAKSLGVRADEVAILNMSHRWRHLHFLVPEALKNVGYIPLSSNSPLAARTARESRPEIVNNFSAVRHASVFESIKLGADTAEAIQKIISAPILVDGRVVVAKALMLFTPAWISLRTTSVRCLLSANRSENYYSISAARKNSWILSPRAFRRRRNGSAPENALTLQNLLVIFPTQENFSTQSPLTEAALTRHHGVRR